MRKEQCPSIQTCRHAGDDCTAEGAEERSSSCYEADTDLAPETQDPEETAETPDDGVFADEAAEPEQTTDEEASPTAAEPVSYVTLEPDKVSNTFIRDMPVPVPDEELAEHAKEMARLHHLWVDTKLKAKAFAKSCKSVTDKAEEDMVTLGAIIQEGSEERPVLCQWEYHYREGVKKLRRLDTFKIVSEETLTGDEVHLSFDFHQQSEDNVAKFFEKTAGTEVAGTVEESTEEAPDPCTACKGAHPNCLGCCATCPTKCPAMQKCSKAGDSAEHAETIADAPTEEPPTPSAYVCKVCGIDAGSHIYLVRHLRDDHNMKLSDYKKQFPAEG